jgi:hypothetical protein
MARDALDAHPIKWLVSWLGTEAGSIQQPEMTPRSASDISDLKARIAAGEYRLDAGAIAEAMFGRADRDLAEQQDSEMLEARDVDGPSGRVDQL